MAKLQFEGLLLDVFEQKEKGKNYLTLLDLACPGSGY